MPLNGKITSDLPHSPGRQRFIWRKVGQLLKHMGKTHMATYDTFTWREEVPDVVANTAEGIEARAAIPGEDKYNLDHVFAKFDQHFGVHRYSSIKRQEFLKTNHGSKQSMMSFYCKEKDQFCGACGERGHFRKSPFCASNHDNNARQGNDRGCRQSGSQGYRQGGD